MIWNKKKDGAENPGAETPAARTTKAPVLFLQKNWKWLVPVVCVVIAGGVFLLKPKSASTTAVDPSYLEASPEVRDVSNTLSGTGTLNPANTYTVKSLVEGKVLTGEFEEGDVLDEGSILYTLDSSDASTNFEKAEIAMQQAQRSYDKVVDRQYVRAEVDGTVSTLKVAKGDEVTSGQEVAVIRDSSKMLLNLLFLIIGMLMADMDMQHLRSYRQLWKPVLLRLIVLPVILVCVAKYSGLAALAPHGETLIIISLLSVIAPSANIVTQFSQMFGRDALYASLINTVTMLLCIITMPLMITLFQM